MNSTDLANRLINATEPKGVVTASNGTHEIRLSFNLDQFTGEFLDFGNKSIQWLHTWFDIDYLPWALEIWGADPNDHWEVKQGGQLTRGGHK